MPTSDTNFSATRHTSKNGATATNNHKMYPIWVMVGLVVYLKVWTSARQGHIKERLTCNVWDSELSNED